jgi:c-di-GMP-binding flagellar brake protein YcgR
MENTDKVSGKNLLQLIEQLKRDKTFIRIRLLDKRYDELTNIREVRTRKGISYILIDFPRGFMEAVAGVDVWELRIDFLGKDKVPHTFRTSGGEIHGEHIWLRFPEFIERLQRRRYFRVNTPVGSRMVALLNSAHIEMIIIDISEGGALVTTDKETPGPPILENGQYLKHFKMVIPTEEEKVEINVKGAQVRRVQKDPMIKRYRYGIEFTDLETDTRKELRDVIYRIQRELLKKR